MEDRHFVKLQKLHTIIEENKTLSYPTTEEDEEFLSEFNNLLTKFKYLNIQTFYNLRVQTIIFGN